MCDSWPYNASLQHGRSAGVAALKQICRLHAHFTCGHCWTRMTCTIAEPACSRCALMLGAENVHKCLLRLIISNDMINCLALSADAGTWSSARHPLGARHRHAISQHRRRAHKADLTGQGPGAPLLLFPVRRAHVCNVGSSHAQCERWASSTHECAQVVTSQASCSPFEARLKHLNAFHCIQLQRLVLQNPAAWPEGQVQELLAAEWRAQCLHSPATAHALSTGDAGSGEEGPHGAARPPVDTQGMAGQARMLKVVRASQLTLACERCGRCALRGLEEAVASCDAGSCAFASQHAAPGALELVQCISATVACAPGKDWASNYCKFKVSMLVRLTAGRQSAGVQCTHRARYPERV